MSKKSVEEGPSETALFVALRRTIANKEFKNEKFGPDEELLFSIDKSEIESFLKRVLSP